MNINISINRIVEDKCGYTNCLLFFKENVEIWYNKSDVYHNIFVLGFAKLYELQTIYQRFPYIGYFL